MIDREFHETKQGTAAGITAAVPGEINEQDHEVLAATVRLSGITHVGVISSSRISGIGMVHLVRETLPYASVQLVSPLGLKSVVEEQKNSVYLIDVMSCNQLLGDIVATARIFPCLLICRDDQLDGMVHYLKTGAMGVIDDQCTVGQLHEAIYAVSKGNLWVPEEFHWRLLQVCLKGDFLRKKQVQLTKMQKNIARLLAEGLDVEEIAVQLETSKGSVSTYVSKMRQAFDVGLGSDINRFFAANPEYYL